MKLIKLGHDLEAAAATATQFLGDGGVVLMPMDTSYGLAADATRAAAVNQVFRLKGRDHGQPFSVVMRDREQAEAYGRFSPQAARLWDSFLPGPLTIVVPLAPHPVSSAGQAERTELATGVTGPDQTTGLRQPKHDLSQSIAERFGKPYTATSANRTGQPPAYSVDEFLAQLPDGLAPHLVLDGGSLPIGQSSTVVRVIDRVEILRPGAIKGELIEQAVAGELH